MKKYIFLLLTMFPLIGIYAQINSGICEEKYKVSHQEELTLAISDYDYAALAVGILLGGYFLIPIENRGLKKSIQEAEKDKNYITPLITLLLFQVFLG